MTRFFRKLLTFIPFYIAAGITVGILMIKTMDDFKAVRHIFDLIEYRVFDFRMQLRGIEPQTGDVVIVAIDDRTLDELGRWPFSRSRMGDAVTNLKADGAAAIAWDVVFSEADQNSELVKMRELRADLEELGLTGQRDREKLEGKLAALRQAKEALPKARPGQADRTAEIDAAIAAVETQVADAVSRQSRFYSDVIEAERRADNDLYFAQAISAAGNVILGYFFHQTTDDVGYSTDEQIAAREALIAPSRLSLIRLPGDWEGTLPGASAVDVEANIPLLSAATREFGYFTIQQDSDGTIRNYPLIHEFRGHYYPSLALKAVAMQRAAVEGFDVPVIVDVQSWDGVRANVGGLQLGDARIPVDERGQLLINYRGPKRQYALVSFVDAVRGTFPPGTFTNRIALIGPTAIGIMDLRVTPFDQNMPGVEVHANAMDNILAGTYLQRPDWMVFFDVLAVIVIGILLGIVLAPLRSVYGAVAAGVLMFAYLVGGQWLLDQKGIWLSTVYPTLEIVAVFAAVTIYKYYTEERKRKEVRSAFQYYLSPAVIEQVLENPDRLKLGGEKKTLTVMFSDVRGFTTISETLDAEELSALLNEYLTPMTDIVFATGGTLDKYMGDALMAIYGAPLDQPDHAERACGACLQMMDKLQELKAGWAQRGLPPIDIGIGLNTGPMSVGNMGSTQRFDYTVMGDAVNLGSRLEGINKEYGTHIIIGPETAKLVRDGFFLRELDSVAVKGKKEPVVIFELIGRPEQVDAATRSLVKRFEEALAMYRAGRFAEAFEAWRALSMEHPEDGPTKTFSKRARELMEEPPEGQWNGVFVAKSK